MQGRLQQLYLKLGLLDGPTVDGHTALYNSRARSIAIGLMQRLITAKSVELAEQEHSTWLASAGSERSS